MSQHNRQQSNSRNEANIQKVRAHYDTQKNVGTTFQILCYFGVICVATMFLSDTWFTAKPLAPYVTLWGGLAIGVLTTIIEVVGNIVLFDSTWQAIFEHDFGDRSRIILQVLFVTSYAGDIGTNYVGIMEFYVRNGNEVTYTSYFVAALAAFLLGMTELGIQIAFMGAGIFGTRRAEAKEWLDKNSPPKKVDVSRWF